MRTSRKLILLSAAFLLTGCSTVSLSALMPTKSADPKDYTAYTRAQIEVAKAAAAAETARIQALAEIAKTGSDAAKIIATQAIEKNAQQIKVDIVPPKK